MSSHPVAGLPTRAPSQGPTSDAELCVLCPKLCRFGCPVATATGREEATPTVMLQLARAARRGEVPWSIAAEAAALCTACGACRSPCEFDQDVPSMLRAVRAEAWEQGARAPGAAPVHRALLDHGTPFAPPAGEGADLRAKGPGRDPKARVLYWPGCRVEAEGEARLRADLDLFAALGADHLSLPARDDVPRCCGGAACAVGDQPGLQVAAAGLDQYFNRQRTWISPSSLCLRTVLQAWPEVGHEVRAEVVHTAEYIRLFDGRLRALGERARQGAAAPHVYVFDACGLHRLLARGSATREVLAAAFGVEPQAVEPDPDRTACCGGGDLFDLREPACAVDLAVRGAPAVSPPRDAWIVTGDPDCVVSLRRRFPNHRVFDLLAALSEWFGPLVSESPAPPTGTRAATPM